MRLTRSTTEYCQAITIWTDGYQDSYITFDPYQLIEIRGGAATVSGAPCNNHATFTVSFDRSSDIHSFCCDTHLPHAVKDANGARYCDDSIIVQAVKVRLTDEELLDKARNLGVLTTEFYPYIETGQKIAGIKWLRERSDLGLLEGKRIYELEAERYQAGLKAALLTPGGTVPEPDGFANPDAYDPPF